MDRLREGRKGAVFSGLALFSTIFNVPVLPLPGLDLFLSNLERFRWLPVEGIRCSRLLKECRIRGSARYGATSPAARGLIAR